MKCKKHYPEMLGMKLGNEKCPWCMLEKEKDELEQCRV